MDATGWSALLRPRIAVLVLATTAVGFILERPTDYQPLPWTLLGTLLVAGAGCALNHYLERDADACMERTRNRPLVTGALTERQVLWGGTLSAVAGLVVIGMTAGGTALLLQLTAVGIYLGVYTPLKKRTSSNTWVGALPGALPLVVGAAAAGGPSQIAWAAFVLVFIWQMPHFFAIASMYREQYATGGMRMLSAEDPEDVMLRWQMPLLVMSVMLTSLVPVLIGVAGPVYGLAALGLGALFLLVAFGFRARADRVRARRVVIASVVYLPLVLAALTADVVCGPSRVAGRTGDLVDGSLPRMGALPSFRLQADDTSAFTREDLLGHVWVVDFIFSNCSGICGQMSEAYQSLAAADLACRFLSITVDPARDDPAKLAAYRAELEVSPERWRLLTGTSEAIQSLAEAGFRLPVNTDTGEVEGMPAMFHSGKFALVDAQAQIRGYYDHRDELDLQRLRQDIARLAGQSP